MSSPAPAGLPGTPVLSRLAFPLALGLLLGGCVSSGKYQLLVDEHAALVAEKYNLDKKFEYLSATNQSLDEELVRLGEEGEDLRQERARLEQRVHELESSEALLTAKFAARERQLKKQSAALAAETKRAAEMRGAYDGLVSDLESQVAAGQIEIAQLREGLKLNVAQDILFPSGSATLNDEGRAVLKSVAQRLIELPYRIEVEGHTDNAKIGGNLAKRYPSNWELAGARASSVVRLFLDAGIDGARLSASSRGPYQPIASNDTVEGRAQNRRIEIRLLPDAAARAEDLGELPASGLVAAPEPEPQAEAAHSKAPAQP